MTLDAFIEEHFKLNQISAQRQRDSVTVLGRFEEFLGRDLNDATAQDITRWMSMRIQQGYDPNYVRKHLSMLKTYFRWARRAGLLPAERWLDISELRPPRGATGLSKPRPYRPGEIKQFWLDLEKRHPPLRGTIRVGFGEVDVLTHVIGRHQRKTLGRGRLYARLLRHLRYTQTKAVASLALYEGLRQHEIFLLTVDDLTPDNAYILVRGKRETHREKIREVPWSPKAREAVDEWLRLRRTIFRPRHRSPWLALWNPKLHRPLTTRMMEGLLFKVGPGYELHRLRHTFATERLRAGMPLERLQAILGHGSLQQTLAYSALVRDDLHKAMAATDTAFEAALKGA